MGKPSERWKKIRRHVDEVKYVLTDCGHMNRHGEITGWIGKEVYDLLNKAGHTSLDFNNCICKDKE